MTQFKAGFFYLLSGFNLILKPEIRLYVIIPLLINVLLFTGGIVYGVAQLEHLIDFLISQWQWFKWIKWLLWSLFFVSAMTIIFFSFSLVANLIGAPFNSFLAEAVECVLSGKKTIQTEPRSWFQEIKRAFQSELKKISYFIIRVTPLLILFIIPVVNMIAPIVWFLCSIWMLIIEYMDYPMSNHGILFAEQRRKLIKNKPLIFGFGLGVVVLTCIPIINFLAMPIAVAGATHMLTDNKDKFLNIIAS